MKLIDVTRQFNTEEQCLAYIVKARWPNGVCCIYCGSLNVSTITREAKGRNKRATIYQCLEKDCKSNKKQFSATSGTIFNDTHLPLPKWFMAIAMICEAKKGMSAKQVERHLGINYRTAWHLCHRIREAMQDGGDFLNGVVEADHTYMTPRRKRKGRPYVKKEHRDVVLGMVERGGRLRLVPVRDAQIEIAESVLMANISPEATLQTDEHPTLTIIGQRKFADHRAINHSKKYVVGENHTQNIENAFSLLKRGIYGTFHKVSIKHLGRYCNEFSYRFNRRDEQLAMFDGTLKNLVNGKALPYQTLTASPKVSA